MAEVTLLRSLQFCSTYEKLETHYIFVFYQVPFSVDAFNDLFISLFIFFLGGGGGC